MALLRSDAQVALNDLLTDCRKTAAQYQDSAQYLEGRVSVVMGQLAEERTAASQQLERAICRHGDLPSGSNEDRETIEQLYHRVHARLADDGTADRVEQMMILEQAFTQKLVDIIASERLSGDGELLHDLLKQTRVAVARLNKLLAPGSASG